MRLRLSVQRHRLPPTNILWSVPDTHSAQAYTVARLLEDVNTIIPLEAAHWGLDDYAVEVAGFECLHFSPVSQTLKDDDEVSIRPLLTAEVRARTLTGRIQISEAGQHLVDGIPFGRPYLRAPNRPAVRIPPRKRQRLLEEDEDTLAGYQEGVAPALILPNREETSPNPVQLRLTNGNTTRNASKNKTVTFQDPLVEEGDSDEEDDSDFAPGQLNSDSDASADPESNSGSESDSDSDSVSSAEVSDSQNSSSDDSSESSSDESDSDSNESSGPEVLPAKLVPPGQGRKSTQVRNKRRREAARLRALKDTGIIPEGTTLSGLRAHEAGQAQSANVLTPRGDGQTESIIPKDSNTTTQHPKKRKRGKDEADPESHQTDRLSELERRKQQLMDSLNSNTTLAVTKEFKTKTPEKVVEETKPTTAEAKRVRPNVSAIGRILARQTRPLDKRNSKAILPLQPEPEKPIDPDLWKSRINVSAFECWDEEFTLSAPPFPFKQHWDPASKLMREKAMEAKQNKKRKRNQKESPTLEEHEEESTEATRLDYGHVSAEEFKNESYALDAVESQLMEDVATAPNADLPALPEDVDSLPALTQGDIKTGAIIVFKLFTINNSTMSPEISGFQTARVQDEGDSGNGTGMISLRLAERDKTRIEKRYDKGGARIYSRADLFRLEDSEDEEEDGITHRHFGELLEAKLLQATAAAAAEEASAEASS
ncbi:hypothetical protein B0J11DRAFT_186558 [Dendryphion nanum]|uniref:DUF7357 domain-containing protein n=1 Tax=Dendryphion nanum TaxID=256645 RepID=A0A9P9I926_9PLEO|nr:hypothetical protein B0J11DRAFT_186558 [Dendryphion nanum]